MRGANFVCPQASGGGAGSGWRRWTRLCLTVCRETPQCANLQSAVPAEFRRRRGEQLAPLDPPGKLLAPPGGVDTGSLPTTDEFAAEVADAAAAGCASASHDSSYCIRASACLLLRRETLCKAVAEQVRRANSSSGASAALMGAATLTPPQVSLHHKEVPTSQRSVAAVTPLPATSLDVPHAGWHTLLRSNLNMRRRYPGFAEVSGAAQGSLEAWRSDISAALLGGEPVVRHALDAYLGYSHHLYGMLSYLRHRLGTQQRLRGGEAVVRGVLDACLGCSPRCKCIHLHAFRCCRCAWGSLPRYRCTSDSLVIAAWQVLQPGSCGGHARH